MITLYRSNSLTNHGNFDTHHLHRSRISRYSLTNRLSRSISSSTSSSSSESQSPREEEDNEEEKEKEKEKLVGNRNDCAQTTFEIDEAVVLSNIASKTEQKKKQDEFSELLKSAKEYSANRKKNGDSVQYKKREVQAEGKMTAEDRIKLARGYSSKSSSAKVEDVSIAAASEASEDAVPIQQKQVQVKIISRDTSYNPFDEDEQIVGIDDESGVNYKPKVSSWGVFPRPKDISKEYGGGKTMQRPRGGGGQVVIESKEETEARKKRVQEKLEKYKLSNNLNMNAEEQKEVEDALELANEYLRIGSVKKGIDVLEKYASKVNERSELGGKVIFCYAMCLDNAQRRKEAEREYKRVLGNQYGMVSKQADRMLWGMNFASQKMKADLFDYENDRKKYVEEKLVQWTNPKWRSKEEDEEESRKLNQQAVAFVLGMVVLPLASFVAYLELR